MSSAFPQEEYSAQTLTGLDCGPGPFSGRNFTDCRFIRCLFPSTDLTSSVFSDCIFDHCEFTLTKLNSASLRSVTFRDCKLVGVDFSRCRPDFLVLKFEDCLLDNCNFSGLRLPKTPFPRCHLRECVFLGSDLSSSDFSFCDLESSTFQDCDLRKSDFRQARNYLFDPLRNKIIGSRFSLPDAAALLTGLGIVLE